MHYILQKAFHFCETQAKRQYDDIVNFVFLNNNTHIMHCILQEAFHFCETQAKQQYDDMVKGHAYVIDVITQPKYTSMVNKDMLVRIFSLNSMFHHRDHSFVTGLCFFVCVFCLNIHR